MPRFENRFWDLTSRVTPTVHCMRAAMLIAPPLFVPSQLGPINSCRYIRQIAALDVEDSRGDISVPQMVGQITFLGGRLLCRSHRQPHDVFNPFFASGSFSSKHESKIGLVINFEAKIIQKQSFIYLELSPP